MHAARNSAAQGTEPVAFEALQDRFAASRILVVGDLMIDRYIWGRVDRISPEAPVPVVATDFEEDRPGGAANVALNLLSLGVQTELCGIVGTDLEGQNFISLADELALGSELILRSEDRPTTVKTRVLGNRQQMLRIDREEASELPEPMQQQLMRRVLERIQAEQLQAIVLEDYDKGVLSRALIQAVIRAATYRGIPVFADPKLRNFFAYRGIPFFKPNLRELAGALQQKLDGAYSRSVEQALQTLRKKLPHAYTVVTLGEHGILMMDPSGQASLMPAHYRQITDVSGAGDTVVSTLAAGIVAGLAPEAAVRLANLAGGLVCERAGVVPIDLQRLGREVQEHQLVLLPATQQTWFTAAGE